MQRTISLKTFLPYPPTVAWQALTDSSLLGSWFMENDIVPVLHHEFTFRMSPQKGWDGITYCTITAIEPGKSISYTYCGEATGEKALACAGIHSDRADKLSKGIFTKLDTVVTFTLASTCGGTLLSLRQSGYKGLKLVLISYIMEIGWKKQLKKKLPAALKKLDG